MGLELLPDDIRRIYEVREWKHALAILKSDFPTEYEEIISVLRKFKLKKSYVGIPGGNVSPVSQFFNREFKNAGWLEKSFDTKIVVDSAELASPTHLVDCVKNRIALEIEWSNKDPFYDRDLNNFRLLFELRAVSVGVIITKSNSLIQTLRDLGIFSKYGMTTTWMSKLLPRIEGGGGGGCPILVFGITDKSFHDDITDTQLAELNQLLASVKKLPKNNRASANRSIYDLMATESNFNVVLQHGKQTVEHFRTVVLPPNVDEVEEEEEP